MMHLVRSRPSRWRTGWDCPRRCRKSSAAPGSRGIDPARKLHRTKMHGRTMQSSGASAACWRASITSPSRRLRKQVEPVTAAQFMRWLLRWQHVAPQSQLSGERGLLEAVRQLQGFEIPANAWEKQILARRDQRLRSGGARSALPDRSRGLGPAVAASRHAGGFAAKAVAAWFPPALRPSPSLSAKSPTGCSHAWRG